VTRAPLLIWLSTAALAAGALAVEGARYGQARGHAQRCLSELGKARSAARELISLQAAAPAWARHGRPATGLTPRISAVLSAAGLPASAMSSLSPEAESPIGDSELLARRTRATLTLGGVTLPQLGSFLSAWRSREPQWTIANLDLSPQGGKGESAGGDMPLRVVIGLETLFVESGPAREGFINQARSSP
jgi:hypothetical protein